jgi:hypothetical protein
VRRADNLTTFMCRLSRNLGASTSWNPKGLSRSVMGLLYHFLHSSEGERAMSTAILVPVVSGDLAHSEHHSLHRGCWLNLGWVEPEHWNTLYTSSAIVCVVTVKHLHSIPPSVATMSHWDSSLSLSIITSDIWFGFSRRALLLMGSKACPFYVAVLCVLRM